MAPNYSATLGRRRALKRHNGSLAGSHAAAGAAPGAGEPQAPGAPARSKPPAKRRFNPMKVLRDIDTNTLLTGKDLTRAARALTALEIRPQLHGYKQLANQLTAEREQETAGLGALGSRLQGGVTDVYRNIAASEAEGLARQQALGQMLNQRSGEISSQGANDLAAMQSGQLGDYTKALEMRGAPGGGSAQQELARAVAAQQAAQNANSQAAQQFAASQASGYGALGAGLAGAGQLQGGEAVAGIGRDVLARKGEADQKYREGIQTALGKLADVKALKGASMVKNLLELRGGEQKFALGQAAVRGEKSKLKLEAQEAAEDRRQNEIKNAREEREGARKWKEYGLDKWEAHHPNASSGEIQKKKQEIRHDKREVRSLIGSIVGAEGAPKTSQQVNALINAINSKASADPQIVSKVVKNWWETRSGGTKGDKNLRKHYPHR